MRISDWSSDVCSSDLRIVCESGFQSLAQGFHAGIEQRTHGSFGKILQRCLVDEAGKPRLDPLDRLANIFAIREADSEIDPLGYAVGLGHPPARSEEHTSELQSLMRTSYAVFCLKQ